MQECEEPKCAFCDRILIWNHDKRIIKGGVLTCYKCYKEHRYDHLDRAGDNREKRHES